MRLPPSWLWRILPFERAYTLHANRRQYAKCATGQRGALLAGGVGFVLESPARASIAATAPPKRSQARHPREDPNDVPARGKSNP
jgi:hypothetical protein